MAAVAATLAAAPLAAQDPPAEDPSAGDVSPLEAPLPNFEAAELARSRRCVPELARIEDVTSELEPRRQRAERIQDLHRAVTLEDSLRVAPLAEDDSLEREVREWFIADRDLALRYLDTEDEAIRERRRTRRQRMLTRLEEAYGEVSREAEEIVASAEDLARAVRDCEDRIFIRSAVLEACETASSPVCEAARSRESSESFRFVDDAADLWNVEQLRPWSEPSRLRPTPDGGLGGARTASRAGRGNLTLDVSLEAMIRPREALSEEQLAEFDANLASLGFEFELEGFVMAPVLAFELDVPGTLGRETHYLLHFGDLSDPARDVLQTVPVPESWPLGFAFPATEAVLSRLAEGEPLSVTAVRMPEGGDGQGEAVYSLSLTAVGQARSVGALLEYMESGDLADDLAALLPSDASEDVDAPREPGPSG